MVKKQRMFVICLLMFVFFPVSISFAEVNIHYKEEAFKIRKKFSDRIPNDRSVTQENKQAEAHKKLQTRLAEYENAFLSEDYVELASFLPPSVLEKLGGSDNFAKVLQEVKGARILNYKLNLTEFDEPENIIINDNIYFSLIEKRVPVTTEDIDAETKEAFLLFNTNFPAIVLTGMRGVSHSTIFAFSKNEGNAWYFTSPNEAALKLTNIKPEILKMITVPETTLVFGVGDNKIALIKQNGKWKYERVK